MQCHIAIQSGDYAHEEIQTWTLTGPPNPPGSMVYPATWTSVGQGGMNRAIGAQTLSAHWNTSVPGVAGAMAIFLRVSDHKWVVKSYHSQLRLDGGTSGAKQLNAAGTAPTPQQVQLATFEWGLPLIEGDGSGTTVIGSGTVVVGGSNLPMMSPSQNPAANCQWQFSKNGPAGNSTLAAPNQMSGPVLESHPTVATTGIVTPTNNGNPNPVPATPADLNPTATSIPKPVGATVTAPVTTPTAQLTPVQPVVAAATPTAAMPAQVSSPPHQLAPVAKKLQPPLMGWVDLHTHPMSNLAFGGKLFHGAPDSGPTSLMPGIEVPRNTGCRFDVPAADISEALSQDGPTSGDPFQSKCGDFIRNTFAKVMELANDAQQQPGNANGYPDFTNWPRWNDIVHQKMWWEWVARAKDGGLRVMVALAHNNRLLGEVVLDNNPGGPISGYADDANSADLQIKEIAAFVNHHTDVMELAKTSADLYNIVQRGHIAVVLGIEVDNLGDFNDKQPISTKMVDDEINRLYTNGVRYIFPIHLTDNVFGDTALYDGLFNLANFRETGRFWTVGCSQPGDQVSAHTLGLPPNFPAPPGMPTPPRSPDCPLQGTAIPTATGNVNVRTPGGLTTLGQYAVKAMMKKGMIVDIDHMSNAAVETALQMAEKVPNGGFPLMSGHSGVRNVADFNKENSRTPAQLKRIACLGGMFGLGTDGAKATDWARQYAGAFNIMNSAFPAPGSSPAAGACTNPSFGTRFRRLRDRHEFFGKKSAADHD